MKTLQQWLDTYAVSHQNPTNKTIHWICIPVIFLTVIGLLASIPSSHLKAMFPELLQPFIHWGTVAVILALVFYLRLSFVMFIAVSIWCSFCLWLISIMALLPIPLWQSSLILFTLAWIGQFYGHKVEGAKPSFFEDIQFLLIGPAWLIAAVLKKLKINF